MIVRLHRLHLPLVRPFRTSYGTDYVRDVMLVEVEGTDGVRGWGECVTEGWPGYSPEYTDAAIDVLTNHLIPAVRALDDDADPHVACRCHDARRISRARWASAPSCSIAMSARVMPAGFSCCTMLRP